MTTAQSLASLGSLFATSPLMFRNKIINGNFDIWQRGTSLSNAVNNTLLADRWNNFSTGTTTAVSRQTFVLGQVEVPGNPKYFHRTVVTSVAGAANYASTQYRAEGVQTLSGQTATLSFWAKADADKSIAIEFYQFFGGGGSPSATVTSLGVTTVALTSGWKKFQATVTLPTVSGKTLGTDAGDFLSFNFWMDAGSNFSARANSLGQQSGTFDIAQVQLESGSVATPFEQRPIGTELSLCQRYYNKILSLMSGGAGGGAVGSGYFTTFPHPVEMRTAPVATYSNISYTSASALGTNTTTTKYLRTGFTAGTTDTTYVIADVELNAEL